MNIEDGFIENRKSKSLIRNETSFSDVELQKAIKDHGKDVVVQQVKAVTKMDDIKNIPFIIDMGRSFFLDEQQNPKQFVKKVIERINDLVEEEK